jgi:hypothetical protein
MLSLLDRIGHVAALFILAFGPYLHRLQSHCLQLFGTEACDDFP